MSLRRSASSARSVLSALYASFAMAMLLGCGSDESGSRSDSQASGSADSSRDASDAGDAPVTCGAVDEQITLPYGAELADGCTHALGNVHIPDAFDATVVAPLAKMTRIDGRLSVFRSQGLPDLRGLERLTYIGKALRIAIDSEGFFTSLAGLEHVEQIGGLQLDFAVGLTSLRELAALKVIHGDVFIRDTAIPQAELDAFFARVTVEGSVTLEGNAP